MPRTIAVDCPGCPPVRALTFDVLGLIKVIESRGPGNPATPKIVQCWGEPDASRCVLSASSASGVGAFLYVDSVISCWTFVLSIVLLALARNNGHIELVNPLNGDVCASVIPESAVEDPIVGLYLFKKQRSEMSSSTMTIYDAETNGGE